MLDGVSELDDLGGDPDLSLGQVMEAAGGLASDRGRLARDFRVQGPKPLSGLPLDRSDLGPDRTEAPDGGADLAGDLGDLREVGAALRTMLGGWVKTSAKLPAALKNAQRAGRRESPPFSLNPL